eukprot:705761-Alexandrium_andersonii.AAC.1
MPRCHPRPASAARRAPSWQLPPPPCPRQGDATSREHPAAQPAGRALRGARGGGSAISPPRGPPRR